MCITYDGGIICDCKNCKQKQCWSNMRSFTKEEAKAYQESLDKLSKPTGVNMFELMNDEKYITISKVIEIIDKQINSTNLNDKSDYNWGYRDALRELKGIIKEQ